MAIIEGLQAAWGTVSKRASPWRKGRCQPQRALADRQARSSLGAFELGVPEGFEVDSAGDLGAGDFQGEGASGEVFID